jgi:hypothetical protein
MSLDDDRPLEASGQADELGDEHLERLAEAYAVFLIRVFHDEPTAPEPAGVGVQTTSGTRKVG